MSAAQYIAFVVCVLEHREAAVCAGCRRCDVTSTEVDANCGSVDDGLYLHRCLIVVLFNDAVRRKVKHSIEHYRTQLHEVSCVVNIKKYEKDIESAAV